MNTSVTYELTDWFDGSVLPEVPGTYQARTPGGHVFDRRFDGRFWINAITGKATTAELEWRGVKPGSIPVSRYPIDVRPLLGALGPLPVLVDLVDPAKARAAKALYDETMTTP